MFGDKYKKDMEAVSPSPEALANTAEKMNAARRPQKRVYRRWVSLAAACLLVAGIAALFPASRFFSQNLAENTGPNDIVNGIYGSCAPEDKLDAETPEPQLPAPDYTTLCAIISDKLNEYKEIPDDEGNVKEDLELDTEINEEPDYDVENSLFPSGSDTSQWISDTLNAKDYDYLLSYNDKLVLICSESGTSEADIYSISKKEKLVSFTQSGEYICGKIENGKLYLVTLDSNMHDLLGTYNNSDETIINNLPYCGTEINEIISANRIYVSDTDLTFTVASCIDLETYKYTSLAVMGGGSKAYIKDGTLYLDKNGETKAYAVNGQ